MAAIYIIGGIVLLIYGIWQTVVTVKIFMKGKQDWLGADIKILGSAITAIMMAAYLLIKYI